jgi:hypothetical protein
MGSMTRLENAGGRIEQSYVSVELVALVPPLLMPVTKPSIYASLSPICKQGG